MNLVATFPRTSAVLIALLMLAPTLPVAAAEHVSPVVPDVPQLGRARPGDECIRVEKVSAELLAAANALAAGDTAYFAYDRDAPALCGANGQRVQAWADLVRTADAILDNYRNVSREIQRQADQRLEYTFPDGPCIREDNLTRTPTPTPEDPGATTGDRADQEVACGVVRPRFVVLDDYFDGSRLGGFGDWSVVTERGEAAAWKLVTEQTFNGTQSKWRLGDDEGYPRGIHQWLVSPELDLTAVRGDYRYVVAQHDAYRQARGALYSACNANPPNIPLSLANQLVCAEGSTAGGELLVRAYEKALDAYTQGLPLGQEAVTLDLTFRMNLAPGEDGVRPWIWIGDEAPTRVDLFDRDFILSTQAQRDPGCVGGSQLGAGNQPVPNCFPRSDRGGVLLAPGVFASDSAIPQEDRMPYTAETAAFNDPLRFARTGQTGGKLAFTGDQAQYVTVRANLSEWIGKRVFVLFEAATMPDLGRGEDPFADRAKFPRGEDFGFELAHVRAEADAYPRNLRLKDVAQTYGKMPASNPWSDPVTTRTTSPPGNDGIAVRVHNAGTYVENATLDITLLQRKFVDDVPVGGFVPMSPQPADVALVNLRPGESREVRVPWPAPIQEGWLYQAEARLILPGTAGAVGERGLPSVSNATSYADPNVTSVRPANAASAGLGGAMQATSLVRAYTNHVLTVVRANGGSGPVLEQCRTVTSSGVCDQVYTTKKGERRVLQVGVKNEGANTEDAKAILILRNSDGVDKSSAILDGAERDLNDLLPGETRAVQWAIAPAEPGLYKASIALLLADGTPVGDLVTRNVYVQRSTGLICLDNMADLRECSASFSGEIPAPLEGHNLTAALLASDGTLYVASEITNTTGKLFARSSAGAWSALEDLSSDALTQRLGANREDLGYGNVTTMTLGPDGTLYLAGDNQTALARRADGTLLRLNVPAPGTTGGLVALPRVDPSRPLALTGQVNRTVAISGGALGGTSPYAYEWTVKTAPDGASTRIENATTIFANFTANRTGTYELQLNVTDAAGNPANDTLEVNLVAVEPECGGAGILATHDASAAAPRGIAAADARCLRVRLGPAPNGNLEMDLDLNGTSMVDAGGNAIANLRAVFDYGGEREFAVTYNLTAGTATVSTSAGATPSVSVNGATITVSVSRAQIGALFDDEESRDLTVEVRTTSNDLLETIEGTFTYLQDFESPPPASGLVATPARGSATAIRLDWDHSSADPSGVDYVVRRQDRANGSWVVVARVPCAAGAACVPAYVDEGLVTGHAYAYTVQAIDRSGRGNPSAQSGPVSATPVVPFAEFADSAWWNGTLRLAGSHGKVHSLNLTTMTLEPDQLILQSKGTSFGARYLGDLHAMLVHDGSLFVAGDAGGLYSNAGYGWNQSITNTTADLLTLASQADRVFASGEWNESARKATLLRSSPVRGWFDDVPGPQCSRDACDLTLALAVSTGALYFIDDAGRFAACDGCETGAPTWELPAVPTPSVPTNDILRPATLRAAATSGAVAVLVGDGGAILEFAKRTEFANRGDWTTAPSLLAEDGGALSTGRVDGSGEARMQAIRFTPEDGSSRDYSQWTQLRVTLDHHVSYVQNGKRGEVRIFYLPYPTARPTSVGGLSSTCTRDSTPDSGTPNSETVQGACNNTLIMRAQSFSQSTPVAGWERAVFYVPGPQAGGAPVPAQLAGIEFYSESGVSWSIDDFRVDGLVNGRWVNLIEWYAQDHPMNDVVVQADPPGFSPVRGSWSFTNSVFDIDVGDNAWHLTTLTDRPVWAANNERFGGGSSPRLDNGWDARLLTPIVDLSDAPDPVLSFRHSYAFRTTYRSFLGVGDVGWVEVQYMMVGAECGADASPATTCWSNFTRLLPFNREEDGKRILGYPNVTEMGYPRTTIVPVSTPDDAYRTPTGPSPDAKKQAGSFWGRLAIPNEKGVIESTLDTSTYKEELVFLNEQEIYNAKNERVNLSGRQVRFGFHLYTYQGGTSTYNAIKDGKPNPDRPSFPGEGWYITDIKVKGARELGMDLRASALEPRVGYDVDRIGIGPGTRIPINVTVANRGTFEVPGYTGELEIRRVLDARTQRTERVATIALNQQPLLEAGAIENHTFFWDVPATEGAEYVFSFEVTPLGIDRDEDPTDNVATLGTIAKPIRARTHPEFNVEILVTPENATTDIPRYVSIFIDNTGNVPLSDFTVTRRINVLKGVLSGAIDERAWTTQRPVPAGTRVPLAAVSDDVDAVRDLFWKAPERSNYLFQVYASAPGVEASTNDRRIAAFATYFFDDVDAGPRGETVKGDWEFEPGWSVAPQGFRSDRAYAFGDSTLRRYADDADAAAVSPVIDLSTARSARFGLYTRYTFADNFDAGVVEASVDGGRSWHRLAPKNVTVDGERRLGYNETPIGASSPLHLTGDPRIPTLGFTGDSALAPDAVDGWMYREFDLTQFSNITEDDVPYELFDHAALGRYRGTGVKDDPILPTRPSAGTNVYFDTTWNAGAVDEYRYWEVQNLTEDAVKPPTGDGLMWWSGSTEIRDDGTRPVLNSYLSIPYAAVFYEILRDANGRPVLDAERQVMLLDAEGRLVHQYDSQNRPIRDSKGKHLVATDGGIPREPKAKLDLTDPELKIELEWWEWQDRYGQALLDQFVVPRSAGTAFAFDPQSTAPPSIRFNVGAPDIAQIDGRWFRMVSDITGWDPLTGPTNITFAYTPVKKPIISESDDPFSDDRYLYPYKNDRGLAIDGFTVRAFRIAAGQQVDTRVLLSDADAWNVSTVQRCNSPEEPDYPPIGSELPCWKAAAAGDVGPLHRANDIARRELRDAKTGGFLGAAARAPTAASAKQIVDDDVDFLLSGVQAGDVLNVTDGMGKGRRSVVLAVRQHELDLAAAAIGEDDLDATSRYEIENGTGHRGMSWGLVSVLPALPVQWQVAPVRVENDKTSLPTGEATKAWYSGSVCGENVEADPNLAGLQPGAGSNNTRIFLPAQTIALGVKIGDIVVVMNGPGLHIARAIRAVGEDHVDVDASPVAYGSAQSVKITRIPGACVLPGQESRLVTPAIDLGRVAGDDARLRFWHRYWFSQRKVSSAEHPFASGGTVEIQAYDPQTGKWGEWRQLYAVPENLEKSPKDFESWLNMSGNDRIVDGEGLRQRGGYSMYTSKASRSTEGAVFRNDMPFETIKIQRQDGRVEDVSLLYSGNSSQLVKTGDSKFNAWVPATFDLTQYIGKKVRIGFHVALTGDARDMQDVDGGSLPAPEIPYNDKDPLAAQGSQHANGWWITNVSVIGKVIAGAPVQLRLRAATDGNLNDGEWLVDDMGLFGARYGRNVGIFVDPSDRAFGALEGRSVTVPITLRNLGDTVRRDLAIEVRQIDQTVQLALSAGDPNITATPGQRSLRLSGFNLAPAQSVTVPLVVTMQPNLERALEGQLAITLKEYSAAEDAYVDVADNEVQGFLRRFVTIHGEKVPTLVPSLPRTAPALAAPGDEVQVSIDVENRGFGDVRLDLTCAALGVRSHDGVDHKDDPKDRFDGASYPCVREGGVVELPSKGKTTVTFRTTPTEAGIARFTIAGRMLLGTTEANLTPTSITAAIGVKPVILHDNATPDPLPPGASPETTARSGRATLLNWTPTVGFSGAPPKFDHPTGHAEPGALLLGLPEGLARLRRLDYGNSSSGCGSGGRVCQAVSRPIDLHNYSSENLVLSFWHQDRFADGDGGQVTARVLLDETRPDEDNAWTQPCVLYPRGGYDGRLKFVRSSGNQGAPADDMNGYAFPATPTDQLAYWPPEPQPPAFFTNGGTWESQWSRADFDLAQAVCDADPTPETFTPVSLLGRTVRIAFSAYAGAPNGPIVKRGYGQGWLLDDIVISPMSLQVGPATQAQTLLDNTTKVFNVVVENKGSYPDVVGVTYDAGNSSAPASSLTLPAPVELAPGEKRAVQVKVTLPRDPSLLPTQFRARLVVGSLLDKTLYYPTDLDLGFAPRQWPELAISVDMPRTVVQEGTETFIPVTIENNGLVDSVQTTLRVTDRWVGGEQVYEIDVPPMPSYFQKAEEASRVLEFRWRPPRGSVGPHTLTFEADPLQLGEEYTRVNNVLVVDFPVSDLLIPDLDVAGDDALSLRNAAGALVSPQRDADVSRYEVTAGELATLAIKLRNPGKAGATNVDVRAFIGALSLPPKTVPYVPPGGEVTLTFNWLAQKGEYPIEVVVRSEQVEASNLNNRNPAQGVAMLIVKGYEVKLSLADLTGEIEAPATLKVPFNITNTGNAGEDLRLDAKAPDGWIVTLPRDGLFLRAGETYSATATVVVPDAAVAGEQFISIHAIARENPMKVAAASTPVHVRAFYGGSVVATPVVAAPPDLDVPITLSNEGNSLEPWQVHLRLPPGWTSKEPMPLRVVVPPRGETTVVVHAIAPETTAPGTRQMLVRAILPDGQRRESTVTVDVEPLRAAAVRVADERPREAQGALAYPVTIENRGNVETPFKMLLLEAPRGIDVKIEPAEFTLAPGGKTLATLLVTPGPGVDAGAYAFTGYTLFDGVQPDTAEGRANVQQLQLTLVRPDLRVAPLEYAPRVDVAPGDRVAVKVSVTNRGQGVATDVPVHLFVDDVFVSEARVRSVGPNEKRDVILNWTALPGEHTLTAVVDPYKDSVDVEREDNAVSALLTVEAQPVTGGLTGGAKVPGFGAPLTLLAAAAVVLALMGRRRTPR